MRCDIAPKELKSKKKQYPQTIYYRGIFFLTENNRYEAPNMAILKNMPIVKDVSFNSPECPPLR